MIFAETSFVMAAYREQANSALADEWMKDLPLETQISPLVVFEFENALRFQVGLFGLDRTRGFPKQVAEQAREDFRSDLRAGIWRTGQMDFALVLAEARRLSEKYSQAGLHRAMDILHVATALHWKVGTFLTFDARQAKLARAVGMKCPLEAF